MTLGAAAAAKVRVIVWCDACGHQFEPLASRSGLSVIISRLACEQPYGEERPTPPLGEPEKERGRFPRGWLGSRFGLGGGNASNGAPAAGSSYASNSFSIVARAATPGPTAPRSDVRSLFPILWQIGYTVNDNVRVGQTRPDERYKKEQ
jgi:hypothetical protein